MTLKKLQVHTCIEENVRKYSVKSTRKNGRCSHKPSSSVLDSRQETNRQRPDL